MKGKRYRVTVWAVLAVLLTALIVLAQGCGKPQAVVSGSGFPMTVTDDLGRRVTINSAPQRIVSLLPATTETLFALGLGDKVVGVTEYCDYPAAALGKPKIGGFSTPSAELIVAAKPDLVLAGVIHKEIIPQLENAGLTVVATDALNLARVLEKIRLIGQVSGASGAADNLIADMQRRIDLVAAKVKDLSDEQRPTVYFEIWPEPLTTGGAKSFINSLIVTAGGKNIAGDAEKDWVILNSEVILARDPDVIFLCYHGASQETAGQLKARKGWGEVSAVKQDRICTIQDENTVIRSGPRVVEGLELMAKFMHPDLFK